MKKAVLLVNLGTPEAPQKKEVRSFLNEFLSDKRVLDIPWLVRQVLLKGIILPFRTGNTTHAYQSVWSDKGSPLLVLSKSLQAGLQHALGDAFDVQLAMRYGEPSLKKVLLKLAAEYDSITLVPLYPQYASSTTGSILELCYDLLKPLWNSPSLTIIPPFYSESWYVGAIAEQVKSELREFKADHLLMSFHGLPVRQLEKSGCGTCQSEPCPTVTQKNHYCYRAQCFETARSLSELLELQNAYSVAFQSRLGRIPWIRPYTDEQLQALYAQGVRRLSVICPSFVSDCLETLEEIGIQLRERWINMGGEAFQLLPCLNDHPLWVDALAHVIEPRLKTSTARVLGTQSA